MSETTSMCRLAFVLLTGIGIVGGCNEDHPVDGILDQFPELELTVRGKPDRISGGDTLECTITVANASTHIARGVIVSASIKPPFIGPLNSSSNRLPRPRDTTMTWTHDALGPGETLQYRFSGRIIDWAREGNVIVIPVSMQSARVTKQFVSFEREIQNVDRGLQPFVFPSTPGTEILYDVSNIRWTYSSTYRRWGRHRWTVDSVWNSGDAKKIRIKSSAFENVRLSPRLLPDSMFSESYESEFTISVGPQVHFPFLTSIKDPPSIDSWESPQLGPIQMGDSIIFGGRIVSHEATFRSGLGLAGCWFDAASSMHQWSFEFTYAGYYE